MIGLHRCLVTWNIANYRILLCNERTSLKTPVFCPTEYLGNFQLHIRREQNDVSFLVEWQFDLSSGPLEQSIWYEVRFKKGIGGSDRILSKGNHSFLSGCPYRVPNEFPLMEYLSSKTIGLKQLLYVTFDMYFFEPRKNIPEEKASPLTQRLEALSSDLLGLYESGIESEHGTCYETLDGPLLIHNKILDCRSPYFKENPTEFTEKIKEIPRYILDKILRYIYSGCFEFQSSDFNNLITLRDAIFSLELPVLTNLFEPKIFKFSSNITSEMAECIIYVEVFSDYVEENVILENEVGKFSVRIYSARSAAGKTLFLEVKVISLEKYKNRASIGVDVFNKTPDFTVGQYHNQRFAMLAREENITLKFVNTLPTEMEYLKTQAPGGILPVQVSLIFSFPYFSCEYESETIYCVPHSLSYGKNLTMLSQDLLDAFDEEHKLNRGNVHIPHPVIAAARCPVLKNREIDIRAPPEITKVVFKYIYNGKIELSQCSEITIAEICSLANQLNLPLLSESCYDTLKLKMCSDNVIQILQWATTARDEYLQTMAISFIHSKWVQLFADFPWNLPWAEFGELNPVLYDNIYAFILGNRDLP